MVKHLMQGFLLNNQLKNNISTQDDDPLISNHTLACVSQKSSTTPSITPQPHWRSAKIEVIEALWLSCWSASSILP